MVGLRKCSIIKHMVAYSEWIKFDQELILPNNISKNIILCVLIETEILPSINVTK